MVVNADFFGIQTTYAQCTGGPTEDCDGDGIQNSVDIDNDNDGILDVNEFLPVELITNGDFSGGNTGWTSSGNVLFLPSGRAGFNGGQSTPNGIVSQSIITNTTQLATFTFDLGINGPGTDVVQLEVFIDGISQGVFQPVASHTINFTPTSTLTLIEFRDASLGTLSVDVTLDNVSVIQNQEGDTDSDGLFDHLDLDSDNDGIPDNIEAQTTQGYIAPDYTDSDNDGLMDAYDATPNGTADGAGSLGLTPVNTDGSDTPDCLDLDSDNDGVFDIAESGLANNDSDNDGATDAAVGVNGLDDDATIETADDYTDVNGLSHDGTNFLLADADNDTDANGSNATPLGFDLDFRDNRTDIDTDADGIFDIVDIDDDNDGILDAVESIVNATSFSTSNGNPVNFSLPGVNTGNLTVDVRYLDNSFNLQVNGTEVFNHPLDGNNELQFQTLVGALNGNVRFQDGDSYGVEVPQIWALDGTKKNPVLRVILNSDGVVELFGSKVSRGPLFPLELINGATTNSFTFNALTTNNFVVGQSVNQITSITGAIYGANFNTDADSDGLFDHLDLDSDNDGIPDNIEAQTTQGYIAPDYTDSDNDGLMDAYDATPNGTADGAGSLGLTPVNTDGTDEEDYLDLDSDNDGIFDIAESGLANNDSDNDGATDAAVGVNGLDDDATIETVDDYTDVNGLSHDGTNFLLADADNDTDANGSNATPLGFDLDFRDNRTDIDTDADGIFDIVDIDDDNDGILDVNEKSTNCSASSTPIASVIVTESITYSSEFNWINDGVVAANRGPGMNNVGHHMVLDLGQVYTSGTVITFDIWGNSTSTRIVITSEVPDGLYLPAGGANQSTENVNINGSSSYTYTLSTPTQYVQVDMTVRNGGRTEWVEATITNSCTYSDRDTDSDGIVDHLDLDSDNDGIYDLVEVGHRQADSDANGIIDGLPTAFGTNGFFDALETIVDGGILNYSVADSDFDGAMDAIELDSDNDTCLDVTEAGFTDDNGDGLLGPSPVTVDANGLVTSRSDGYTSPTDADANATFDFQEAGSAPSMTSQPTDVVGTIGNDATFTATASGSNLSYQWQTSTDEGATFTDITDGIEYTGSQTTTLTVLSPTIQKNGHLYRAIIRNVPFICDETITSQAELKLRPKTVIMNRRIRVIPHNN